MNKYQILKSIGDGTYGTVYEGINKETNQKVAIKKLKNKMTSWEECMLQNEVRYLSKLNKNENIIKLLEVIREQNNDVSYIFEYCDCNLFEFIERHRKQKMFISEAKIRNIIYQITCGIKYLHSNNIMHRDLKPENILIILNDNLVKIADFGTAKEIPDYQDNSLTDYVCTRWYRAPECTLKSHNYNEKIDIWAIGCIMAELYTLKPIFPGNDEFDQLNKILNVVGTPEFNDWPEGYALIQKLNIRMPNYNKSNLGQIVFNANGDAIKFLESIFQLDPKKRPSASDLLKHPYFTEVQRPGSYSYQLRSMRGIRDNKNYSNSLNFNNNNMNNKFHATANTNQNNYNNDIGSPSTGLSELSNKNRYFSITERVMRGINNNQYNNNNILGNNKEENFFKLSYDRSKEGIFPNNINSFRNSYKNINLNNNQMDEISKNNYNYNYYKNLNFSNYINNNRALPDIDTVFRNNLINLKNNNAYSKYNNDHRNDNPLLNSYNQLHNNKFSSFAKSEIMQNIKRDNYFSVDKRNYNEMNNTNRINDRIFNNISPFSKERIKGNYYDSDRSKSLLPNIYKSYRQVY